MELLVFDLDGTLLDRSGTLSEYTRETLAELSRRGIAYTVATGRTLPAARELLDGHGFSLPHVYKNGVMIWNPESNAFSHQNFLSLKEIEHVLRAILAEDVTPFIFTFEPCGTHTIYHEPLQHEIETQLARWFSERDDVALRPAAELPAKAEITNISAVGDRDTIARLRRLIEPEPGLVAYSGVAWEGDDWRWIDIHHRLASKGGAIDALRGQLGVSRVICFGDSDNDLSMFECADESYAPENASEKVKQAATAVIGDHDADGIARFLRERFGLGD